MSSSQVEGAASLIVREVEGEILLLDGRANRIHRLNPTASTIWRRWQDGFAVDRIAAEIAAEFDVEQSVVQRDVGQTLSSLQALGLLDCGQDSRRSTGQIHPSA